MKGIQQILIGLALLATLALAGCGGSNNGDSVIDNWVGDASGAIETQNLSKLSNLISESYLNDCFTKDDLVASYADVFDSGDITSIDVQTLETSDKLVDEFDGVASFFWRTQWTINYADGTHDTTTTSGTVFLVHEASGWKEYGDQLCVSGNKAAMGPLGTLKPTRLK